MAAQIYPETASYAQVPESGVSWSVMTYSASCT